MIIFIRVYTMLETLGSVHQYGRYHHFLRGVNGLTSPVEMDPISNTSRPVVISSCALFFNGSMTRDGGRA